MGDFIPLFLVQFPYNYLRQNESFKLYVIREIVKCEFWSKNGSFGTFVVRLAFYARLGSPKITIYMNPYDLYDYMNLACN